MVDKTSNKAVLFILRNHFTNDSRVLKEARTLTNAGYNITIRCLWDKHLEKNEIIDKINIERVAYSQQGVRKSLFKKITAITKYSYGVIKNSSNFSVIHCHDLDALPIGVVIKWFSLGKKKLVYDAHEYETERHHIHGFLKSIYKITERFFIRFADSVITVSPSIADEYVRLYKINRPYLVLNCPLYTEQNNNHDIFRNKFNIDKNKIIFLYQGGMGVNRGIETTIEIFKNLEDKNKVIVFMGDGNLDGLIKTAAKENDNIFYHDAVSPDNLLDYTASADIGVFFCNNNCLSYYYCLPNKIFEYTMAGLPVIVSDLYEIKRIINKYHNGIAIQEKDTEIRKAINNVTLETIEQYKQNIPEIKKLYNWEQQEKVLLNIYKNL